MKYSLFLFLVIAIFSCSGPGQQKNEYLIEPVPFTRVQVTDQFWSKRIKTNHDVTIPIAIQKSRETGRIRNFAIAGGLDTGKFCSIYPFDDSDIYKIIEGAAYSLQMFPDPKLEATVDSLVYLIGEAQEDDGYLYTNRTIMGENSHPWAGKKRWEKEDELSHELYNLGHFYEAATAYYQATGKQKIMDIAIKSANLVDHDFGYGKIENYPGHQEIEIGLVKLFRTTGDKKYLDLAKFFLDIRGKGIGTKKTYNQSHLPVIDQREAVGHSVRGAYMWTGMADVAALTGDQKYKDAITAIWEDVVYKKLYITGGIGAAGGYEGFGGPYELPNMRAYCETCAAIANVFLNYRMFLMTGDSRFVDVLERSLYNNVLSGVSLSGDHFFYPNPLESHGQHKRSEWFGCACCPSNICRFIPSMPNYIYGRKGNDIYINLFVASKTSFALDGGELKLEQSGNMPWDGNVAVTLDCEKPVRARLNIRIPGWASGSPVPGDLYSFINKISGNPVLKINGEKASYKLEKGYAVIERKWKKGDLLEWGLPFEIRKIEANPKIEDDKGKMALQLGPLVYCAEFPDQDETDLLSLIVPQDNPLNFEFEPALLGGVNTITGDALGSKQVSGDSVKTYPRKFKAIPYYGWSHRGQGQMEVWLPVLSEAAHPIPEPTLASMSTIEASYKAAGLKGINDLFVPKNSKDESTTFYHWWPRKNQEEWVVYNFPVLMHISSSSVYWFEDFPDGGCKVPASWKLMYKKGKNWVDVVARTPYPVVKDDFSRIEFEPVETTALKLVVRLPEEYSSGIHEWVVK